MNAFLGHKQGRSNFSRNKCRGIQISYVAGCKWCERQRNVTRLTPQTQELITMAYQVCFTCGVSKSRTCELVWNFRLGSRWSPLDPMGHVAAVDKTCDRWSAGLCVSLVPVNVRRVGDTLCRERKGRMFQLTSIQL